MSQLSVAVMAAPAPELAGTAGMAEHSTVTFAGTPAKTGSVVSIKWINWLCELVFPQSSVAVQVRMMSVKAGQSVFGVVV